MAVVDFENLIDINLLSYYDVRIKEFILEQINNSKNVIFVSKANLPQKGQINILYVTEEGLYLWNTDKYIQINSNESGSNSNIIFLNTTNDLPLKGQTEILYLVGKSFYIWNGTEYVNLSIGDESTTSTIQWEDF